MYPLAELIRRCVELKESGDWDVFLRTVRDVVRGVFLQYSRFRHRVDEFEAWFGGWLITHRSLDAELRAIRQHPAQWVQPEHIRIPEREGYARNYLRGVIHSAWAEFEEENRSSLPLAADAETRPNPRQQLTEEAADVRAAAQRLNQDIRIPFWLAYLLVCGPLLPEDVLLLQMVRQDVLDLINEREVTARENRHRRAFDSTTIGQLMGVTHACVDQRVRTALLRVREYLGLPPEPTFVSC